MKNFKLWDFLGWDTKEARNERNLHNNKYGFYGTVVIVIGLCIFGFVVWG